MTTTSNSVHSEQLKVKKRCERCNDNPAEVSGDYCYCGTPSRETMEQCFQDDLKNGLI